MIQVPYWQFMVMQVPHNKVATMKEALETSERKVATLTRYLHSSLKLKGEPNFADTIISVKEHLMRRACCRFLRQDMQVLSVLSYNASSHFLLSLTYTLFLKDVCHSECEEKGWPLWCHSQLSWFTGSKVSLTIFLLVFTINVLEESSVLPLCRDRLDFYMFDNSSLKVTVGPDPSITISNNLNDLLITKVKIMIMLRKLFCISFPSLGLFDVLHVGTVEFPKYQCLCCIEICVKGWDFKEIWC